MVSVVGDFGTPKHGGAFLKRAGELRVFLKTNASLRQAQKLQDRLDGDPYVELGADDNDI